MKKPTKLTRRWLKSWAGKLSAKADTQQPYWFIHNVAGEERTFCFECGENRRKELQAKYPNLENLDRLDGGWHLENDGCQHCDACGQLLEYSLTDYGAESEWEHFQRSGILLRSAAEAYHIQAILDHGLKLTGLSRVKLKGKPPV